MRRAELDEIARRARGCLPISCTLCSGTGQWSNMPRCPHCSGKGTVRRGGVRLLLRDDPAVAQSLSADDVANCRYPLCPGGPMGRLVCVDPHSETGMLRVEFEPEGLLAWALEQGAKLPAEVG
jgi:hypothetical protein